MASKFLATRQMVIGLVYNEDDEGGATMLHKNKMKATPEAMDALKFGHKKKTKASGGKLAADFKATTKLDLKNEGGPTIQDLVFINFYLGTYPASDRTNLDSALSAAFSDPGLQNIMAQYYTGPITSQMLPSKTVPGSVSSTFDRDSVDATLKSLIAAGSLNGIDFDKTIVNLMLPPGIILTTDRAGGPAKSKAKATASFGDLKEKDTSLEGLGGYHGSSHLPDSMGNAQRIYFAVGAYSEFLSNGSPNGIPFFHDAWKNVSATFYHELNEARTDPDVEDVNRNQAGAKLGWYSAIDGEIGDIPMVQAGQDLGKVMVEVTIGNGALVPIQLMYSNAVHGPAVP